MIHDRKTGGIWFAAGVGLGALAGLLLAPKSGRQTREAIAAGVDHGRKYLVSFKQDAGKRLTGATLAGKKMLARKKKQLTIALAAGRDRARRAKESSLPRTGTALIPDPWRDLAFALRVDDQCQGTTGAARAREQGCETGSPEGVDQNGL